MPKRLISFLSFLFLLVTVLSGTLFSNFQLYAQSNTEEYSKEEALIKLKGMLPKEEEFVFQTHADWKPISLTNSKIFSVNSTENVLEASKIIDGKTNTTWKTNSYTTKPEAIIDLGSIEKFNRIVLYNRQTMNRGSGGGNNAVKTLEISYSLSENLKFIPLGKFQLHGPKEACVLIKGGGRICTFIDNPEPNVIETPTIEARYIKLNFVEAFWGEDIPLDWKDSFSLTEIMFFNFVK